jgi:hypothetical protein
MGDARHLQTFGLSIEKPFVDSEYVFISCPQRESEERIHERLQDQHDREREHELAVHEHEMDQVLDISAEEAQKKVIADKRFSAFGPALGNFSIQYNLSCAGIALREWWWKLLHSMSKLLRVIQTHVFHVKATPHDTCHVKTFSHDTLHIKVPSRDTNSRFSFHIVCRDHGKLCR